MKNAGDKWVHNLGNDMKHMLLLRVWQQLIVHFNFNANKYLYTNIIFCAYRYCKLRVQYLHVESICTILMYVVSEWHFLDLGGQISLWTNKQIIIWLCKQVIFNSSSRIFNYFLPRQVQQAQILWPCKINLSPLTFFSIFCVTTSAPTCSYRHQPLRN